ncbi:hypothetical protein Ddye_009087 [Dipteronia dyeriana]|uniref:Protein FAR1-RELATED SEQUENCE n=1 Tax=Dipteronia dyeriana TaxID=168575 RepID=A0AAE0CLX8_9ROSI|nr:hypothetical protein Ddye_009087 [Dipteronia dyeriana]
MAMQGKCPITVVTDGDKAIREAIKLVMPGSIHRLCSWHLERNVQTNIGDSGFTQAFMNCMFRCGEKKFECFCILFDTAGIPCCHYFGVMKSRNMHQIRETLILPRWTTNAKDDFTIEVSNNSTPTHIIQKARYGALSAMANRMCYLASKSTGGYKDAKVAINNLMNQMQGLLTTSSTKNKGKLPIHNMTPHVHVKDPFLATTKGGVRQGKKSGGKTRHYR